MAEISHLEFRSALSRVEKTGCSHNDLGPGMIVEDIVLDCKATSIIEKYRKQVSKPWFTKIAKVPVGKEKLNDLYQLFDIVYHTADRDTKRILREKVDYMQEGASKERYKAVIMPKKKSKSR